MRHTRRAMLSVLPFVIAARVLWAAPLPDDAAAPAPDGVDSSAAQSADRSAHRTADDAVRAAVTAAGHDVVAGADADAAFVLAGCRAPEPSCLARAALLAEAAVAVAVVDADDAVVVSAAGERRRVQSVGDGLAADVLRALAPASTARLRLLIEPRGAIVDVDGTTSSAPADGGLDLTPGEHALRIHSDGHADAAIVVVVEAGESLRVAVTLADLPAPIPPTSTASTASTSLTAPMTKTVATPPSLWWLAGAGGGVVVGSGAVIVGGVLSGLASAAIEDAEQTRFQSERQAHADVANRHLAGAGIAYGVGVAAFVGVALCAAAYVLPGDP